MNWKRFLFVALISSSFYLSAFIPNEPDTEKETLILNAVIKYLEAYHFKPLVFDDSFSEKAFASYLKSIDGRKRFLIQSEIDQLEVYKHLLDDQTKDKSFEFFEMSIGIINNSRVRAKKIYEEIIAEGIDIDQTGNIEMDSDKRVFAKDEAELKLYWQKLIQYDLVNRLDDKIAAQEKRIKLEKEGVEEEEKKSVVPNLNNAGEEIVLEDIDEPAKKEPLKSNKELEEDALKALKKSYGNWFDTLKKDRREDQFARYINTLTHVFDPHTDYYSPKKKQDFDIRMGGKLEGIGARLSPQDEYTKVVSIVPGGPAWKGKELEVDDLITAVKQEEADPINITGWRLDDVVQKIRGPKGSIVTLTVKKPDGTIVDIEIERDVVITDDAFARSLLLDMPSKINQIGYISLPKFYSSFENEDGNSCAKDIKKEIDKLKDVDVNGIILDLRSNGGGSLKDVVDMSGLFIEDGPIVQVKPREKEAYLYEDEDPGVHYDGPLIVMVNQFSASASEILAAALQDYKRAIIVGSNSTFGKGTVQRFVDLDRMYRNQEDLNLGNLKITMQKFYRVDGGSTQLKGVTPDIILPNNYHYIETGEKDYDHALEWTEIDPVQHTQDVYDIKGRKKIIVASEMRIAENENFNLILENAKRLKENKDMTNIPLGFKDFSSYIDEQEEKAEKYKGLYDDKLETIYVRNLEIDSEYINFDESRVERNKEWVEGIEKDFYIEEVMLIMKDIIDNQMPTKIVKVIEP